jgi:hypothetical protein
MQPVFVPEWPEASSAPSGSHQDAGYDARRHCGCYIDSRHNELLHSSHTLLLLMSPLPGLNQNCLYGLDGDEHSDRSDDDPEEGDASRTGLIPPQFYRTDWISPPQCGHLRDGCQWLLQRIRRNARSNRTSRHREAKGYGIVVAGSVRLTCVESDCISAISRNAVSLACPLDHGGQ